MDFKYSKQNDLNDLIEHLVELNKLPPHGTKSLHELKSGVFDSTQRISAVEIAIREHEDAKREEQKAYDDAIAAAESLAIKKAAYPKAVKYIKALEDAMEIVQSIDGGHGFIPSDYFILAHGTEQGRVSVMISEAKKGLNYLKQFKD